MTQIYLFFSLLFFVTTSFALPVNNPVPGGVTMIPLFKQSSPKPKVFYKNKPVLVAPIQGSWVAIVGIPLKTKGNSRQYIRVNSPQKAKRSIAFTVKPKWYKTQRLKIRNKSLVNPYGKMLKRIKREQKVKARLRATYTNRPVNLNFIRPVAGRDTGRFGLKRYINGQKRNSHTGMDIAAPTGRSIKAASNGRVLFTGNFFFSGKVVYIDHNQGLISLYAHLNSIRVKKGDVVNTGDVIGTVGKTGRATGPHLHWSMYLNQTPVNPKFFY